MSEERGYWARIAAKLPDDVRIIRVGWEAETVFSRFILWSVDNMTDGVVDRHLLDRVCRGHPAYIDPLGLVGQLVAEGLLVETETGWAIPSFSKWQETRVTIAEKRDARAARQRRYRERKRTEEKLATREDRDGSVTRRVTRDGLSPRRAIEEKRREANDSSLREEESFARIAREMVERAERGEDP